MKWAETAAYLAKALRSSKEARVVADGGLPDADGASHNRSR